MKKLLFILLTFAVVFSCKKEDGPETEYRVDTDTVEIPQPIIVEVDYQESYANVRIPDNAKAYFSQITLGLKPTDVWLVFNPIVEKEIIYKVTGKTGNGSLHIESNYKLTLLLAGVDITSTSSCLPTINIECGKRISVVLQEGTTNYVADSPCNTDGKGAFYTKGHFEFEGGGTLNIEGNARHALAAKEYIQLKKTTGTINILSSVGDGIHCGKGSLNSPEDNCFKMNGGTLNFGDVHGDNIDSDDYGCTYINGGTINLNIANAEQKGIKADSLLYINGGNINITLNAQKAIAIQANYAAYLKGGTITGSVNGDSSVGIKSNNSKDTETVEDGGDLFCSGTDIDLTISGSKTWAINAEKTLTATSGNINITGPASNAPGYKANATVGEDLIKYNIKN